jgi:hypothetical protein
MLIRVANGELLVTRLPDEHMTTLLTNIAHPEQLGDISKFLERAQAGQDLYIDLGDGQPRGLLVKVEPGKFATTDDNGDADYLMAVWHNKN